MILSNSVLISLYFVSWLVTIVSVDLASTSSCVLLYFSSSSLYFCSHFLRLVSRLLSSCFNLMFSANTLSYFPWNYTQTVNGISIKFIEMTIHSHQLAMHEIICKQICKIVHILRIYRTTYTCTNLQIVTLMHAQVKHFHLQELIPTLACHKIIKYTRQSL